MKNYGSKNYEHLRISVLREVGEMSSNASSNYSWKCWNSLHQITLFYIYLWACYELLNRSLEHM